MATRKPKTETVAQDVPSSVTLHQAHGYIDAEGVAHYWPAGFVETCPVKIATLIERKAPLKEALNAD